MLSYLTNQKQKYVCLGFFFLFLFQTGTKWIISLKFPLFRNDLISGNKAGIRI